MKGIIAICHWNACDTCRYDESNGDGCILKGDCELELSKYGDDVICVNYEVRKDGGN